MVNLLKLNAGIAALALLTAAPVFAQNEGQTHGQAVVTVLPAKNAETGPVINPQDLQLKVNGRQVDITHFTPLRGENDRLEVVLAIDGGARTSLTTQFPDIKNFISSLPSNAKVTMGYMQYGTVKLVAPLTTDRNAVLKGLRIPAGFPGENASAYICLSDLARHWPSSDSGARRIVVMITDGVDYYDLRYDPNDPYMQAAISDSVRAGMTVYSIYWQNTGRFDRSFYANYAGQNLLQSVTQATGGQSYWEGIGNPVSLAPYFKDLDRRLQNQYEIAFNAPVSKAGVTSMKLRVNGVSGKVEAPQQVYVGRAAM